MASKSEINKKWNDIHMLLNKELSDPQLDKEAFKSKHDYIQVSWDLELITSNNKKDEVLEDNKKMSDLLKDKKKMLETISLPSKGIPVDFVKDIK